MPHPIDDHGLSRFMTPPRGVTRRWSSWDRTGANADWITIDAGETAVLLEVDGPGCVNHFYCALALPEVTDYRDAILRCYWDGASEPAVEAPLGDFFGLVHGRVREMTSAMVTVNAGIGVSHGLNAYFPMPFSDGARITLEHRGPEPFGGFTKALWYHIDYDVYDEPLPEDTLRFHAQYRQERPTEAIGDEPGVTLHDAPNLDGAENYVALVTRGRGRMAGLVLQVDNVSGGWWGEGDDMVFIDGDDWPPSIHGTGTEEIFGGGACPAWEYAGPYTGFHLIESQDYGGLTGMYRWYVHDPISFRESIRWSIEHGHANNFANHYSSVAYWYQDPMVSAAGTLPAREEMLPRLGDGYEQARALLVETAGASRQREDAAKAFVAFCQASRPFYEGRWDRAIEAIEQFRRDIGI